MSTLGYSDFYSAPIIKKAIDEKKNIIDGNDEEKSDIWSTAVTFLQIYTKCSN